jgi:hypothetical protein
MSATTALSSDWPAEVQTTQRGRQPALEHSTFCRRSRQLACMTAYRRAAVDGARTRCMLHALAMRVTFRDSRVKTRATQSSKARSNNGHSTNHAAL